MLGGMKFIYHPVFYLWKQLLSFHSWGYFACQVMYEGVNIFINWKYFIQALNFNIGVFWVKHVLYSQNSCSPWVGYEKPAITKGFRFFLPGRRASSSFFGSCICCKFDQHLLIAITSELGNFQRILWGENKSMHFCIIFC